MRVAARSALRSRCSDEKPLEEWARRREERRAASKGRLRTVPLTEGRHRAAVAPDTAVENVQELAGPFALVDGGGGETGEVLGLDDPGTVCFGEAGEAAGQWPLTGELAATREDRPPLQTGVPALTRARRRAPGAVLRRRLLRGRRP
ncbi:DUF6087 family protein [Streptomyces sp. NPDC014983]|uniref:DUF6087 family protein n=1 Tax=Streptomyces sp. NPDC014983 TaxID=3364933 RepID=UPI003702B94D